jgi:hypothetical protein
MSIVKHLAAYRNQIGPFYALCRIREARVNRDGIL